MYVPRGSGTAIGPPEGFSREEGEKRIETTRNLFFFLCAFIVSDIIKLRLYHRRAYVLFKPSHNLYGQKRKRIHFNFFKRVSDQRCKRAHETDMVTVATRICHILKTTITAHHLRSVSTIYLKRYKGKWKWCLWHTKIGVFRFEKLVVAISVAVFKNVSPYLEGKWNRRVAFSE